MFGYALKYAKHVSLILLLLFFSACKHREKAPVKSKAVTQKTQPKASKDHNNASQLKSLLHLSEKEIHDNELYKFSNEWYGTPYLYGGCTKKGVDCSCFTGLLYQQVYHKTLAHNANDIFKACDALSIQEARQGDLVFFKIGGRTISHVGVVMKGHYFIHASSSSGVMLSNLDEAYFKKYFFCAGRVKKS